MLIRSALSLSLWAVRRCSPSCRSCYRSVIRLIPLLGYSGERPRLRRACKHPRNSAKPLQQLHRRSETALVFPSCQNIIVLVGGVVLPPPHVALGTDRLARCQSCKACQNSAMLPLAKKIPYVTRPASCSHSGMFAVTVARRHRIPFSIFSVNIITPSPSCRLWSISACRAKDTPKE